MALFIRHGLMIFHCRSNASIHWGSYVSPSALEGETVSIDAGVNGDTCSNRFSYRVGNASKKTANLMSRRGPWRRFEFVITRPNFSSKWGTTYTDSTTQLTQEISSNCNGPSSSFEDFDGNRWYTVFSTAFRFGRRQGGNISMPRLFSCPCKPPWKTSCMRTYSPTFHIDMASEVNL